MGGIAELLAQQCVSGGVEGGGGGVDKVSY